MTLEGNRLTVDNRTPQDWNGVEIWLNTHYRVTTASIPAGGRFQVYLDSVSAAIFTASRLWSCAWSPNGPTVSRSRSRKSSRAVDSPVRWEESGRTWQWGLRTENLELRTENYGEAEIGDRGHLPVLSGDAG